jgi:plastocyanin
MRKVSVFLAAVAVLVACGGFVAIGCGDDKAPVTAPVVKNDAPKAAEPVKSDAPAKVEAPKAFSLEVSYTPISSQSGGSIAGQVKVKDAPKRKKINMDADPKCAAMHAEKLMTEEVVADAEGNVQWAFVYVDKADFKGAKPTTPVTIDQKGCKYEPHVLGVMVGQDILIRNSDDLLHNIHALPFNNKEFNFGQPSKGMEEKKSFGTREVMVKIKCDVHPWMSAWAGVLDHPYFAVTDAAGKFEIKGVPAGKYTVKVWQEKYKDVSAEIEVKEGAAANKNFELAEKKGE